MRDLTNKAKQAARREIRKNVSEIRESLTDQMAFDRLRNKFIKTRPKFFPRFLWRFLVGLVLDLSAIEERGEEKSKKI